MRTSERSARRWMRSERLITAGISVLVAMVLLTLAWLVPLETRNARGERREKTALTVWREMLNHLPDDAPVVFNAGVLAILSVVALVTASYVVVAIARLPR